jgi:hypothetical protein
MLHCNARWVRKDKIHTLVHLLDHIIRFGPAPNFATEKFESYNGVLREQLIHSNRHNPSRDIAVSFVDYKIIRHLVSGGYWKDKDGSWIQAGTLIRSLFEDKDVRMCLGYKGYAEEGIQRDQFSGRRSNPGA